MQRDLRLTAQTQTFPSLAISADNTGTSFPSMPSSSPPLAQPAMRNATASSSRLKARPVPPSTFNSAAFAAASPPISQQAFSPPPTMPTSPFAPTSTFAPLQPTSSSFAPLQPTQPTQSTLAPQRAAPATSSAPNYNISLAPQPIAPRPAAPPTFSNYGNSNGASAPAQPLQPAIKPPPGYGSGLMQPTVKVNPTPSWSANSGWDDFDPLK